MKVIILKTILMCSIIFDGAPSKASKINTSEGTIKIINEDVFIEFDIKWKLSWRDEINWDAAWVFFKAENNREDIHIPMAPSGHRVIENSSSHEINPEITVSEDSLGSFIYLSSIVNERVTNGWKIQIKTAFSDPEALASFQGRVGVHAIEMVYIPEGSFELGSPLNLDGPRQALFKSKANNLFSTYFIDSENAIKYGVEKNALCDKESWELNRKQALIPKDYPKGFNAFYMMKYEINQGTYARFLNILSDIQTAQHNYFGGREYKKMRGSVRLIDDRYIASRPYRPCNFISWADAAAFADWAALRPFTELEYTKASRGPENAVPEEFAWGNTNIWHGDTIFSSSEAVAQRERSGTEYIRGNANYTPNPPGWRQGIGALFIGGDGGIGPLREDIFETRAYMLKTDKKREASGAGYYGVIGLSGSLHDRVVSISDENAWTFKGTHGDGQLNYSGLSENQDWPDILGQGLGLRRGAFSGYPRALRITDRNYGSYEAHYSHMSIGFRAARTAK